MVERNNFSEDNDNNTEEQNPLESVLNNLTPKSKSKSQSKDPKEFHSTSEDRQISVEEANQIFESETTEEAPMAVDIPLPTVEISDEDFSGVQGLGEAMDSGSDMTDMQWIAEKLFPSKWGGKKSRINRMMGRLDPAVFLPVIHLNAVDRIMRTDPRQMIDVNEIYMDEYTIASIELDGFGRGEGLELAGASREERRMATQFGGLAGGGM